MTTSRIRHRPPGLWFGAQTANTDSDWRKMLNPFTAGRLFWLTQNGFATALFQFRFNFISVLFQLCGQFNGSVS